jgi:surface antigen
MTVAAKKTVVLAIFVAFTLAACGPYPPGPKATVGGLGGAAAGGLLGAALGGGAKGIAAGVILGGLLGGAIGDRMDAADRKYATRAASRALETNRSGTPTTWRNPDSGNSGTIKPVRTYQKRSGQYCREYQQKVIIGGKEHDSYGTACRMPDGSWKVQN